MSKPMNRFAMFGGVQYYGYGGWNDFIGSFETIDEVVSHWENNECKGRLEWYHCVDLESGKIVRASWETPYGNSWEHQDEHPEIYCD